MQVVVDIKDIQQGVHVHTFELRNKQQPEKAAIGAVTVEVSYEWLRGTTDEGHFEHASQVVMSRRKMRAFMVSHSTHSPHTGASACA